MSKAEKAGTPGPNPGVRVRFAPSPTGSLHVGGVRTALFNWLFAARNEGTFILRIEDTDIQRSSEEHERNIIRDLGWLGLYPGWDALYPGWLTAHGLGGESGGCFTPPAIEGPDLRDEAGARGEAEIRYPCGPYRQTQRLEAWYNLLARRLLEKGLSYRCYCTPEELEEERDETLARGETPRYSGRCRSLAEEQRRAFEREGRKPAIRLNVEAALPLCPDFEPSSGVMTVHDLIHGEVSFPVLTIGDFVLMKSNGTPSYNFACAVDDRAMMISHVIRGDEHLTNTPRQLLLYAALHGVDSRPECRVPAFAHLPMILAPDHAKLSKRHGATSVEEFRQEGFLPSALLNYLALLGWSPGDDRELFLHPMTEARPLPTGEWSGGKPVYPSKGKAVQNVLAELSKVFSLEGVSISSAIFDRQKLSWMNAHHFRWTDLHDLYEDAMNVLSRKYPAFTRRCQGEPYLCEMVFQVLQTFQEKMGNIREIATVYGEIFFADPLPYEDEAKDLLRSGEAGRLLSLLRDRLSQLEIATSPPERVTEPAHRNADWFQPLMKELQEETKLKGKNLYMPIRAAMTGKVHGPELIHCFHILGKKELLKRITHAMEMVVCP